MAQFVIQKVSHRGVSHPVVARLSIQVKDIIEFSGLGSNIKENILKVCIGDLQSRLGKCWDIWQRIENEQRRCDSEYKPSNERVVQIPHIKDLDRDVDNFFYESKNFLRDLISLVLKAFFPEINFSDAGKAFLPNKKGEVEIICWAESKFGKNDGLTKMLREDVTWISELIRKRNAIEHPNGHSGVLTVFNIEVDEDGRLIAPIWQRTGGRFAVYLCWDGYLLPISIKFC